MHGAGFLTVPKWQSKYAALLRRNLFCMQ